MKILVTGGAGYIGSHTIVDLCSAGHEVVVYDNFITGSREAISRVKQLTNRDIPIVEGDVRDQEALNTMFANVRPDGVIHFAGLKAVGESVDKPIDYFDVNVGGSIQLLNAMSEARCTKIVFSSSATVYGTPKYLPYDEDHPTNPANPYGRSKLMVEEVLKDWCAGDTNRAAISLRYFNPVGAHPSGRIGEDPKGIPNNLMPFISQTAVGRRPALAIFGDDYETSDGTGARDYVHVLDLARAHSAALENLDRRSGHAAFNVGTGKCVTVLELVAAFELASGRKIPVEVSSRRPGDLPSSCADAARIADCLNWVSKFKLDDMCRDTWTWQSQNPEGYKHS